MRKPESRLRALQGRSCLGGACISSAAFVGCVWGVCDGVVHKADLCQCQQWRVTATMGPGTRESEWMEWWMVHDMNRGRGCETKVHSNIPSYTPFPMPNIVSLHLEPDPCNPLCPARRHVRAMQSIRKRQAYRKSRSLGNEWARKMQGTVGERGPKE